MTSILKWAAIAVTMVAAGGLTTWALAGTHDSEKQEERADVEKTASAESKSPERKVPTLSVDRPTPTNEDPASANTSPDPSSLVLPQEGYEVTTLGPTRVAIRLAGGPSKVVSASSMGFRDPQNPPAFTHVVSGRILDKTGAPVAGAAILADSSPRQSFTSLMGSAGAMSDASGRFDLTLHKEGRIFVLALHKDHGWSKVESVTTKEGGSDITLRFDEPGVIKGTVSYNKEPVASNIRLASRFTLDDHALELDLKTDEDGRYEFALLPIGDYTLIATQRYSFGGGGARIVEKKVSVKAGGVEIVDFEIDGGSLLVGDVSVPEGELPPSTVEYWLFEGSQTLPTLESIRALAKQLGRGHYQNILYGGKDALTPIQFHDLSPGPVTFCAQYKKQDREVAWLRCTQVEVSSKAEVQEVHFP